MLPAKHRLKNTNDIAKVFREGRLVYCDFLALKYSLTEREKTKIAFSIGLKYSKEATERNYAKRILRESAKKYFQNIKPGYDLVFYFKNAKTDDVSLEKISTRMENVLQRAHLLKSH